jgi:carboxyl-terminal processing protease
MRKGVAVALFVACAVFCATCLYALTDEGYEALHVFTKILHLAEDNYVERIDEKETIHGAIRGMLRSLDPHSVYMTPEIYRELRVDTSGRFDGVGLEVTVRDGWITVIAPIKGSPAEEAGMQPGDKIVKIDGVLTENLDLIEAVKLIRGRRGSRVTLTVSRPGVDDLFDVQIVRRKINVPSVKWEQLDERYGYIQILSFQEDTSKSVRKALKKLRRKDAVNGIILDVRRNPGGLLEEAVAVSDEFLADGVIVTTESRGKEIERYEATGEAEETGVPIVVLVDGGSASASEILAGALRDNDRALVVGTQTFGKGSVQTVFELGDGSALKLTIARYYTPDGISIQAHGIVPDIEVPAEPDGAEGEEGKAKKRHRLREADLSGHLEERKGAERTRPPSMNALVRRLKSSDVMERAARLVKDGTIKDYQKQVALDFLKIMASGSAPLQE